MENWSSPKTTRSRAGEAASAANLKRQADKLAQKANALIVEAEPLDAADQKKRKQAN
jgi:hypothetical protein